MNRTFSKLALAAMIASLGLTGCGGAGSAASPSNAEVTAAVRTSASEYDPQARMDDDHERDGAVSSFMATLNQLAQVPALAPLFAEYGLKAPIVIGDDDDSAGLIKFLRAVRITISSGKVTLTNRATGGVIYSAPLSDLASGSFDPGNMPTTGTTPPPPPSTCSSFTYSAWGACQSNGTQTRTVLTSSPSGCTGGAPVTSQSCTYVPPPPPPPATCTSFTYSTWGACQSNNTQTRTVLMSSPSGCTGGSPVLSQACTYVPPVTTCSSFTYSAWGACQSNSTQSRTVLTSSPSGCTGGSPVLTQACTYVPPVTTCSSFTYSAWGACQSNNTQTRTVLTSSPSGCTGGTPVLTQACTYVPPVCTYTYSAWGACQSNGTQTRTVASSSPSGCSGTPVLSQACTYTAPNPVTAANIVSSCTTCHGLTSNTTVFKSGGYSVSGRSSAQWLSTVNNMVGMGAKLAAGTTAQNYADYLANVP